MTTVLSGNLLPTAFPNVPSNYNQNYISQFSGDICTGNTLRGMQIKSFTSSTFSEKWIQCKKIRSMRFQITINEQEKEEMNTMCNFSDSFEESGLQKGIQEGEIKKLIELIVKKYQRGKPPKVIASELEEDVLTVTDICKALEDCAPNANYKQVYETWQANITN